MGTTTDPKRVAAALGVTVLTHEGGEKGRHYGGGIISLRRGLGPIAARCTLAHELAHHIHGHDPAATGWIDQRQERQAQESAALMLITAADYAAAEALVGPHPGALAQELGVTTKLLRSWQELHERKLVS